MKNNGRNDVTSLLGYIDERQEDAMHLASLLAVIDFIDNEGKCRNEMTSLIMLARRMADNLNRDLDCVNLPEVSA